MTAAELIEWPIARTRRAEEPALDSLGSAEAMVASGNPTSERASRRRPWGAGGAPTGAAWGLVAASVAWNLVTLRAQTWPVSYLDDSSVHEQMVRFASVQIRSLHLPLTSWFPYLGLGSPHFLHYQSLPAMIAGAAGLLVGPNAAFRWSLYLLLSLWPLSVFLAARLFGLSRWAAAAPAAAAPFLMSATGIGYEDKAYLWIGWGVWTQLWASLTLPLAWGLTWRSIREGRHLALSVLAVMLTIALHFETGYLALAPLGLWPLVSPRRLSARLRRAAVLALGTALASAWIIVPLLTQRTWAATNEPLVRTPLVNGYGLGRMLSWMVTGQLLDHGRFPVITIFAATGMVAACVRWRRDEDARALIIILIGCIVLAAGRRTFGSLVDLVPGSRDLFFRRFQMGVQLALLLLVGVGVRSVLHLARRLALSRSGRFRALRRPVTPALTGGLALGLAAAVLAPAWTQIGSYTAQNASYIRAQRRADASDGTALDRLVAMVKRGSAGRTYAGTPANWGADFTVGTVPVFKYLESRDVDEVGYTLRTASLMTNPEYFFDERQPGDYVLFGIRYLILPLGRPPPVPARRVAVSGPYSLWATTAGGYVHAGRIIGSIRADRTNIGVRSIPVLRSRLVQRGGYLSVAFAGRPAAPRQAPDPPSSTGTVLGQDARLASGRVSASVSAPAPGVAVLSASFDPGWSAQVDGRTQKPEMVAPALVAVPIDRGVHQVRFVFAGFGYYLPLFILATVAVAGLEVYQRTSRSRGA